MTVAMPVFTELISTRIQRFQQPLKKKVRFLTFALIFYLLSIMGNNRSIQQLHVYQPLGARWGPAGFGEELLQDRQTGEIAELHTTTLAGPLEYELQRYEHRYLQDQNLVRVLHARPR